MLVLHFNCSALIPSRLVIPNSLTETKEYNNEVLQSIYKPSLKIIASPLQFRQYVKSQKVHRWKIKRLLALDEQHINTPINDGKSRQSQNVQKSSGEEARNFSAKM